MSALDLMQRALALLVAQGWGQGDYQGENGRLCAAGALIAARDMAGESGNDILNEAAALLLKARGRDLSTHITPSMSVVLINDHYIRSEDEALLWFADAIRLARQDWKIPEMEIALT